MTNYNEEIMQLNARYEAITLAKARVEEQIREKSADKAEAEFVEILKGRVVSMKKEMAIIANKIAELAEELAKHIDGEAFDDEEDEYDGYYVEPVTPSFKTQAKTNVVRTIKSLNNELEELEHNLNRAQLGAEANIVAHGVSDEEKLVIVGLDEDEQTSEAADSEQDKNAKVVTEDMSGLFNSLNRVKAYKEQIGKVARQIVKLSLQPIGADLSEKDRDELNRIIANARKYAPTMSRSHWKETRQQPQEVEEATEPGDNN